MLTAIRFLLFFMWSLSLWADAPSVSWFTKDANQTTHINVELFLSSTCPHCHKEDEFFRSLETQTPWLHVTRNVINENKEALQRFNQLLIMQGALIDFAVPSAFFCNARWVGFSSAETTGEDLIKALHYCKQQIEKKGLLTQATVDVVRHWANAGFLNSGVREQPSIVHYLLVVSLLDATNPCSLFCFAAFLAVLFMQQGRRNQLLSGALFIAALASVHYIQQTQANLFFQFLFWLRVPAALFGLASLYLLWRHYKKKETQATLWFVWVFLLALIVQAYQQSCVMNWAYVFEQWLSTQQLANGQKALLQVIYQCFYIVLPIVLLLLYVWVSSTEFFAKRQSKFANIGLLILVAIALFLIVYPWALSYFLLSFMFLLALILIACFLNFLM